MLPAAPRSTELLSGCLFNKDTHSYLPIDILLWEADGVKILHPHNQDCVNSGLSSKSIRQGVADGFPEALLLW